MRNMSRWGHGGALGPRGLWVCQEAKAHLLSETGLTVAGWSACTRALISSSLGLGLQASIRSSPFLFTCVLET